MNKVIYWSIGVLFSALMIIILIFGSYGDKLEVEKVDVFIDTELTEQTATCAKHYSEVLSTKSMYDTFIYDCKVIKDLEYDSDYFLDNVLIVYNYSGSPDKMPKSFYDFYFSVNDKETIQVTYHNKLSNTKELLWYYYLIEMNRDQIATKEVVIG